MLSGVWVRVVLCEPWVVHTHDSSHQGHQGHNYLTQSLATAKSITFIRFITLVWGLLIWNCRLLLLQLGLNGGSEESTSCLKPQESRTCIFTCLHRGRISAKSWVSNTGRNSKSGHSLTSQVLSFSHHLLSGVHLLGLVILSLIAKTKH